LAAYRAWRPKGEAPELQLREPGVTTGEPSVGGAPADEPLESGREPSTAARAAALATDASAPRPTAPRPSASLRAPVLTALALPPGGARPPPPRRHAGPPARRPRDGLPAGLRRGRLPGSGQLGVRRGRGPREHPVVLRARLRLATPRALLRERAGLAGARR